MAGHEIEFYSFGKMKVDGRKYTQDLILYPESIETSWYRREGHKLSIEIEKTRHWRFSSYLLIFPHPLNALPLH